VFQRLRCATLATVPVFWAIYFPLNEEFKVVIPKIYNNTEDNMNHPLIHSTSAIIAGAAAGVVCNPMFAVKTRMQTETLHFLEQ
jgi:hypothetical protein